jgi:AcrR family transcriptional regulator
MQPRAPDPKRRSQRSRQAILQAAFDICRERGYERATIDAIADRAGVGKQTIYRWWPSKGAVIMDALNEVVGEATDFPDSGEVMADLREQMASVSALFTSADVGRVYRGVIAGAQSDTELAAALVKDIIRPRITACIRRLERAQEQGEIRSDANLEVVVELLYGPLYHRFLLQTSPPGPAQVDAVLDLAFAGLRP